MPISQRLCLYWLPALAFMVAIYSLSSLPAVRVGVALEPLKRSYPAPAITVAAPAPRRFILEWAKVGHVIGYFGLGSACLYALRRQLSTGTGPWPGGSGGKSPAWRAGALALLLTTGYALSDEFHQSFVPGRSASGGDVVLDAAAGLGGVVLWSVVAWAAGRVRAMAARAWAARGRSCDISGANR
jgi:VanZ family protein